MDGLAAGSSTIYFITIATIGYIMNKLGGLDVILCLIMVGACLGFLVYNFSPASIFMGDTGSMFLGFIIAIIALLGFKNSDNYFFDNSPTSFICSTIGYYFSYVSPLNKG